MAEDRSAVAEAIAGLLPPLIRGLDTLEGVARQLHPPDLPNLVERLSLPDSAMALPLARMRRITWPDRLIPVRDRLDLAARIVTEAFSGLREASIDAQGTLKAYQALAHATQAQEALFPLSPVLSPVNRFFVEPSRRQDAVLLKGLTEAGRRGGKIGLMHGEEGPGARGGFALFVPELYDPAAEHTLIVALHGGGGNGRRFLWTWLREARTRRALLLVPTSKAETWSLIDPMIDGPQLVRIMSMVMERWRIDPEAILLTGISDGGTFTYLAGLAEHAPFSHLAPVAASFHPMLLDVVERDQIAHRPIYLTHGALDWMFPVEMARQARDSFLDAGARLTYREIPDLSHTYPREVNGDILNWMGETRG